MKQKLIFRPFSYASDVDWALSVLTTALCSGEAGADKSSEMSIHGFLG